MRHQRCLLPRRLLPPSLLLVLLVVLAAVSLLCWCGCDASSPKKRVYAVEYSAINQAGNNIINPTWGSAGSTLVNDVPSSFTPSGAPWAGPPARSLANALSQSVLQYNTRTTAMVPAWWDFIWGDIVYLQLAGASSPIAVPPDDPVFAGSNKQIPFTRAADPSTGRVTNLVTSYIDASTVYGSDAVRALALTNQTNTALLSISTVASTGPLPPRNSLGGFEMESVYANTDPTQLFLTGGQRANESPQLLALHTLFVRDHNRRAAATYASFSDFESPAVAFSEGRRYVIAAIQRITYYEFLPALLGKSLPKYTGYQPTINATPTLLFTHVAMVVYRSQFNSAVLRIDSDLVAQPLSLRDCLYNPNAYIGADIESILLGLVSQNPLKVDPFYVSELRNIVVSASAIQDFLASDIQRGRDLGLPFYNDARQFYGLSRRSKFSDITSNQALAATLARLYNNDIDAVDVLVAGLAEEPASPSLVGELFTTVLEAGFTKLRDGDRFYFESKFAAFTPPDMAAFNNLTLSSVVFANTESIATYPCNAFVANSSVPVCNKPVSTQQVAPVPSSGGPIIPLDGFTSLLGGEIELYFNVSNDGVLNVIIRGHTTGWVGFGLARETGTMIGSDVWIGWVQNGVVSLADYQISARIPGCPGVCQDINSGGFENLLNKAGSESDGWTTLQYSRKLDTGDPIDVVISQGQSVPVVFALGESDVLQYHGDNRGAAIINFFTNQTTIVNTAVDSANDRLTAHGVMMFMAWAVMFPIGLYAVRILKFIRRLREWWFHIHLIVQYLGVLFMITGFALAIEAVPALGHSHFSSTHARMGMAAVVLGIVVPATGQLTAVFWTATPKRWQVTLCGMRIFPDLVHFITGYLSPIFGFITLYWGLWQRGARWYWFMLLSIWIGFVTVVFFGSFIIQQIYSYFENKRSAQEDDGSAKSQSAQAEAEDWDS